MLIREVTAADSSSYFKLRIQAEQEFPQFVDFNTERELAAGQPGIAALLAGYVLESTVDTAGNLPNNALQRTGTSPPLNLPTSGINSRGSRARTELNDEPSTEG